VAIVEFRVLVLRTKYRKTKAEKSCGTINSFINHVSSFSPTGPVSTEGVAEVDCKQFEKI